ncbi:MAG: glycosyltransferase family 2 protein [Oscillospiraceae bacterium]|nr:glycosyltransferase family 2 protein [Oscillospiraceae bacterium]
MIERPVLWIIIPCYNEEQVLPVTSEMFTEKLSGLINAGRVGEKSRLLFVNDGSKDGTWDIIKKLSDENPIVSGISLSCNRGHQNALLAGLCEAVDKCDITISMDCDGQDDIEAVDKMLDRFGEGCQVVYGVRSSREKDTFFKRFTAESFYKLMMKMGVEVVYNHADYRLISNRVLKEFTDFHEVNLFLRGMIPLVGFKSGTVEYKRQERLAGNTHYPLSKMLALAFDGITSLSIKPIRLITGIGILVAIISFIFIIWAIVDFFLGKTVSGWSSTICVVSFIGGIQLIALGVIGEYVGKIYLETKARPRFIIEERLNTVNDSENNGAI